MNANKRNCTYTAQGVLVCRSNVCTVTEAKAAEGFDEGCGVTMAFKECANDNECKDPTMSCRIMPVSNNSTKKVCMPDEVQYATRDLTPF